MVVTSTFKPEAYDRLLHESVPISKLQPIQIRDRASSGVHLGAAHLMMKGRTAEGELTDDRTSLIAERRQAEDEQRENAMTKVDLSKLMGCASAVSPL